MIASILYSALLFVSILSPTKQWFAPDQPVLINVAPAEPVKLILVEFAGAANPLEAPEVEREQQIDLLTAFRGLRPGCYILYAVPKSAPEDAKPAEAFVGTPLVVQIRSDKRTGAPAGPLVVHVEPLRYIKMETSLGEMVMAFYYEVAPNTVTNFLSLAEGGYFDGQVFHRIIKDFVVQGGDPLGSDPKRAGTGGPGYMIDQEFSDRQHLKGVLSMARQGDPLEAQGMMPRSDAANSASSQFFICLNYERTRALDRKYTVFGRVVGGLDVVDKMAALPTGPADRPETPPVIRKASVETVTPGNNPYVLLLSPDLGDQPPK